MSKLKARPLADEASRRIIREDLHTNLLVEAGAGSGKTQMLAERMAAGIATGAYQIEHIAAVTFTRKAASELRGRFHLALEKLNELSALDPAASDARAIERVNAALANLERFFAGTIHSFCARLLRERPVESGVSPGFTELDEVQDEELRNRAWRDFVTSMRAVGDPLMLELLDTGGRPNDLDSAFAIVCTHDDVEFPPGEAGCPDPQPAWKALEKFWKDLEKLLPQAIADETTCPIQVASRRFRPLMQIVRKKLDRPRTVAGLLETWKCRSVITQKWWPGTSAHTKALKARIESLHAGFMAETVTPYLSQWRQYVYRLSVTLLCKAREHAAKERRRRNSLNYGDLLNLTARVLRENGQVRRASQRKYRHLFVDEFQDTDPIQAEIVFLLAADEQASSPVASGFGRNSQPVEEPEWRDVPVRPGALFVVGDPKQSIYRFRRADIEIYNTVRKRFEEPSIGRVVPLTMNFRSVPELCEWANTVFEKQFPSAPTVHSPQFARLDANEQTGERKTSSGLFTLTHAGDAKSVAALDAEAIARYIRTEVGASRRRYSDFLILTRKKKDRIAPYASALEALNIPIEVSGAGAFGESKEVETLTVLLRALADPLDQLTLVNVLRGPLFGLSDAELFEFKQSGGWLCISDPRSFRLQPEESGGSSIDRVARALAALHRYHRWTRILPAGAALDRILEHSGYLALAATTPGGVEAGDLLHAVDRVRQVLEDGGNLGDAADALESDSEASNEVESLPLEPGRTDVVRLMNLHKAKGLEANVVFLADPAGGMGKWVDVHIKRDGAKALGWFKVEKRSEGSWASKVLGEHADWEQHKAAEEPYLTAEEDRLLYVAATRAREMLVVSRGVTNGKSKAAWGVLYDHLQSAKELPVPTSVKVATPMAAETSATAQAEALAARVLVDGRVNIPSWSIASVTVEARHIAKMTAAAGEADPDDATAVVRPSTPSHRADAGMAWGTLIHGLLEHAMRHPAAAREDLRRLAMWLTVEEPQLREVIDVALDTVQDVAKADFWKVAAEAQHSVETPFVMGFDRQLTNGVIDLIFERPDGWRVIDYKTDRAIDEAKYARQLEAYRAALEAVGCAVTDPSVVPVRADSL
jgi:ATP-dependent helicase/nuclease subunit A